MIAGIAAVVKSLKPQIQVIGVEPTGANAMAQSLVRGERVTLSKVDAFAGGRGGAGRKQTENCTAPEAGVPPRRSFGSLCLCPLVFLSEARGRP